MHSTLLARRRALFLTTGGILSLPVLAACTQQGVDIIKTVADFVQAVQQGVVNGIKAACSTALAFVPTVDTVMSIAAQLLKAVGIVSGNLADAVKILQTVIDTIVAAGCPSPAPAPSPTATFGAVPIRFY